MADDFEVKGGPPVERENGYLREDKSGKVDYTLALDGPMFKRYAEHLTKGAKRHGKRNWLLSGSQEALDDYRAGALRHLVQWLNGETDEDHAAAVIFNINGAEYVKERLKK